jgi:hypothetical protein
MGRVTWQSHRHNAKARRRKDAKRTSKKMLPRAFAPLRLRVFAFLNTSRAYRERSFVRH